MITSCLLAHILNLPKESWRISVALSSWFSGINWLALENKKKVVVILQLAASIFLTKKSPSSASSLSDHVLSDLSFSEPVRFNSGIACRWSICREWRIMKLLYRIARAQLFVCLYVCPSLHSFAASFLLFACFLGSFE